MVDADYFTPYDNKKCVTGEFWPVESTPLNFKQPHAIGEHINDDYGQLHVVNGYDHAWALNHPGDDTRPAAWIYDEKSGRKMEIYTTEPAVHIYTGNGLKGKVKVRTASIIRSEEPYASKHVIFRTARTTRSFLLQHWLREKYSKAIPYTSSL